MSKTTAIDPTKPEQVWHRPKYEYMHFLTRETPLEEALEKKLNELGEQGWDVFAVQAIPGGSMVTAKRPILPKQVID